MINRGITAIKPINRPELIAKLKALATPGVLFTFVFRDDSGTYDHKVRLTAVNGLENTGEEFSGVYSIALVSP